jgi:AcrR family transcriptional regulator
VGLREDKAARTRALIVEVAIQTFIARGYDETTMEQIADAAGVGSSTLYRYFPSKDLLVLDPFAQALDFAGSLRARPADEPLELALAEVIRASLGPLADDEARLSELRRLVDNAPIPRARLWDFAAGARADLEVAVAERLGAAPGDLRVALTAQLTYAIFELAGQRWWEGDHALPRGEVVAEVIAALRAGDFVMPALPAGTRVA